MNKVSYLEVESEESEKLKKIAMAEAQLRDQYGNPIPLTDQHGNPVTLTDEHGNPVHVTGIATTAAPAATAGSGLGTYGGTGATTAPLAATAGSGFGPYGGTGATTAPLAATAGAGFGNYGGAGAATGTTTVGDLIANQPRDTRELRRSSSSSSSSVSAYCFHFFPPFLNRFIILYNKLLKLHLISPSFGGTCMHVYVVWGWWTRWEEEEGTE